jgi:hypothetical protein
MAHHIIDSSTSHAADADASAGLLPRWDSQRMTFDLEASCRVTGRRVIRHRDHDIASLVSCVDVPVRVGDPLQRVARVYDRGEH